MRLKLQRHLYCAFLVIGCFATLSSTGYTQNTIPESSDHNHSGHHHDHDSNEETSINLTTNTNEANHKHDHATDHGEVSGFNRIIKFFGKFHPSSDSLSHRLNSCCIAG